MTAAGNEVLDRHAEHMASVRAVQRRSHYARVCLKIAEFMRWARLAEAGEGPPLDAQELDQLGHLTRLRDELAAEMVAAGQLPADA